MSPYELVFGEAAARVFVGASRADQRRLGVILDALKAAPFRRGDLQEYDTAGRVYESVQRVSEARVVIEGYRHQNNTQRPFSRLGNQDPAQFAAQRPPSLAPVGLRPPSAEDGQTATDNPASALPDQL